MWRWSNPDARPVSDYLYNYHDFRKTHRFLYYCRECIRNFEAVERVESCPKCGHASVIELPKDMKLEHKQGTKLHGRSNFKKEVLKTQQELSTVLERLKLGLWRIKIAMYYFLLPLPEEMR